MAKLPKIIIVEWSDGWRNSGFSVGFLKDNGKEVVTLTHELTNGERQDTTSIPKRLVESITVLRKGGKL